MKLGYSSATAGIYDIDDVFRFAQELSLDFVELTFEISSFLKDAQTVKKVNELQLATGIEVSVHLPFIDLNIASLIPAVRKATVDETLRALEYAQKVNAIASVLHTGSFFLYQPVEQERSVDALKQSLDSLREYNSMIALENLAVFADSVIKSPEMLKEITDEFVFANCLDMGHAFIEQHHAWTRASTDLIQDYINTLGKRVKHLHLCNNDGQSDLHQATNNGAIRFSKYRDYFLDFEASICLEVAGGKEAVRQSANQLKSFELVLA